MLPGLDELELLAARYQQSLAGACLGARDLYRGGCRRCAAPLAQTVQALFQPVTVVGFQQIVDGVEVEGANGVFVVGGHEHQQRRGITFELRRDFKTGEPRHLDVEKHRVGFQAVDRGCRGETVRRLACDIDVSMDAKPAAQLVAGRGFIVDDEHPDHARNFA